MAHPQQEEFCKSVKQRFPEFFADKFVLDIGSLDVNGNNQILFDNCQYIGVDLAIGRNVDIVTEGHNLSLPASTFDVIVSTECFEHDRFYDQTLKNIVRLLKPGGMLLFTCATTGRPEHGTLRTTSQDAPFLAQFGEWANYYKNLAESDIREVLDVDSIFSKYEFSIGHENHDLYFWGIKAGRMALRTDYSFQIKANPLLAKLQEREVLIQSLQSNVGSLQHEVGSLQHEVGSLQHEVGLLQHEVNAKNQSINNFIEQTTNLNSEIAILGAAAGSLRGQVDALLRSRSWRVTAPLRQTAGWVRHITRPRPRLGFFSKAVVALCTFPATFYYYKGWREWFCATLTGKSFLTAVLKNPNEGQEQLARSPRIVRVFVSSLLTIALRVKINGGLLPTIRHLYRIARQEGAHGILARIRTRPRQDSAAVLARPDNHIASSAATTRNAPSPSRILVMDYRIPMADISAGERATVGILHSLCAIGYDVVFVPNDMTYKASYAEELAHFGVTVITSASGYQSPCQYIREHGHTFATFYLIRLEIVESVLDTIRQVAPLARTIFHAPDLYFLRESREATLSSDATLHAKSESTRERELSAIRRVDHTVIVSPAELPVLRNYLPSAPISVFQALYAPIDSNPTSFSIRKDVFYLGGFSHTPNVDAMRWFVQEICPLVRERLPNVEFHIVGSEMPQSVMELSLVPGVAIRGFVKDLGPFFSSMRVGIAPLRYGAGIKGKVALTLGAGIPCVCTSIAAEGMGLEDGVNALIADDPIAFAESIVQIYTDQAMWERISRKGTTLVRQRFGEDANRASLLDVLDKAQVLPLQLYMDHCKEIVPRFVPSPESDQVVDVSIIIPVYNQWDYTRVCINSVLESSLGVNIRFEIILADDGSTDETIHATEHYPGLRVFKTPRNVGFLRNCNNAAKHARGRYILLLNNDTVVLPGWLVGLYRQLETDEGAAIAGSKLLYPDGVIQEAGAILWSDGTAHNFGRGRPRDATECSYIREVDYVSGASIMIRKTFWEKAGGFDERYENAYCEDSDLAMTARSHGERVVYVPTSEVIHFEHQSYADQAPSKNTALQNRNIARLVEKWGHVFGSRHLPPASPHHMGVSNAERTPAADALCRRCEGRLNLLYFSPFPSHPNNHGNRATIYEFARRFQASGIKVHFALLQSHEYSEKDVDSMRECWETVDIIPNTMPMLANGNPIPFDGWYCEGVGEQVRSLCAKYDIDVIICSYIFQSKLLEFVPAHVLKIIDTHDKMSNRYDMLKANGQPLEFFSCTREEEGTYLRRADIVIARREEEARYFDSITGCASAIVIPHIEDPHFIEKSFSKLRNVGIVASPNRINLAMVLEFLEIIDRRSGRNGCPFTVHIAGQVRDMVTGLPAGKADVFRRPWVRMHGFVTDIAAFYADMDLIISPVTMGTGINVKTVQAMAYGMPLLTTAHGCKGIETGDAMHTHENLNSLVESLFSIPGRPMELPRLASLSRDRYATFYELGLTAIQQTFTHPKLIGDQLKSGLSKAYEVRFHPGVLEYQKQTLTKLMSMGGVGSLLGKRIMEIGGSGDLAVAKTLYELSGTRVAVVTPDPELHPNALEDEKIELVVRPAENSGFADNSFDLIYGCAVLEHVHEYAQLFRECYRLVRPGGHVLLNGGPHWCSNVGHHVFVVNDEMDYRFIGNNPVPDFGHLYLEKDELDAELAKRNIPGSHREAIISMIYESKSLNRAHIEDILKAFRSLDWHSVCVYKDAAAQPEMTILSRIRMKRRVTENEDFTSNLYIAARK